MANKNFTPANAQTSESLDLCSKCNEQCIILFPYEGKQYCPECFLSPELNVSPSIITEHFPDRDTLYSVCASDELACSIEDTLIAHGFRFCDDCGRLFAESDLTEIKGGTWTDDRYVCESCLDDGNYSMCDRCGVWVRDDETQTVHTSYWMRHTETWCEDCCDGHATYCDGCDEYYDSDAVAFTEFGDAMYCERCTNDRLATCSCCGDTIWRNDSFYDDDEDRWYCSDCYNTHVRDNHKIHNYSYKPEPKPKTRKSGTFCDCTDIDELLFGVELEVDMGGDVDSAIYDIAEACDDVYMKHDGSLDDGFEIVTHPCTLDYHTYQLPWGHICEIAKSYGFKSHDARTCGLHVHVGRWQLGDSTEERVRTISRVCLLVDRHWDNIVRFTRRNEDQLSRWACRVPIRYDRASSIEELYNWAGRRSGDRYEAVNLCNSGTIEFRIFNGTLKRTTLIATLQFLSNLCTYAMTHTMEDCVNSSWSDFALLKEYNELKEYLEERGIADNTPNKPNLRPEIASRLADFKVGGKAKVISNKAHDLSAVDFDRVVNRVFTITDVCFDTYHSGYNVALKLDIDAYHDNWWFTLDDLVPVTDEPAF